MNLEAKTKKKIKEKLDNLEKIKSWKARAVKLKEKNGKMMAAFCRDHGINEAHFNRCKNLSSASFPDKKFIEQIEKALKAEDV